MEYRNTFPEADVVKAPPARSAKEIIDAALGDNRAWEQLCYALVVLLVATGISTLAAGIILGRDVIAIAGGGVLGLFWPAMQFARGFRQDNIRIRLYEYALARAKTQDEAAAVLRDALGQPKRPSVQPPAEGPKL